MHTRLGITILLALLLCPAPAMAQVRSEPAGNSLPDATDAEPHATHHDDHQRAHRRDATHAPGDAHDHAQAPRRAITRAEHRRFAEQLDLSGFRELAVFDTGRVKIIDTLAREQVERIYGKPRWKDARLEPTERGLEWVEDGPAYDPVFTYLDLLLNESYYYDKPLIYVEVLELREELVRHLSVQEQELWKVRGRLTPLMIGNERSFHILTGMDGDLLRQKASRQVRISWNTFRTLEETLKLVSPPAGKEHWAHVLDLRDARTAAALPRGEVLLPEAPADPEVARAVLEQFAALQTAWLQADAAGANAAIASLVHSIPKLNPETYPAPWLRRMERIYNATHRFTIGYVAYLLGTLALLIAFAVQRRWLVRAGVALLVAGFVIHSGGMLVRGVLSGRWPIHNQYESFIAVAWLAVLAGLLLMLFKRQWLFGAAASAVGAAALLFANTVDIPSREAAPVAGILATSRILYVHVNMVLLSYALIALGFVISLFYLAVHYLQAGAVTRLAAGGLGVLRPLPGAGAGARPTPALAGAAMADVDGVGDVAGGRAEKTATGGRALMQSGREGAAAAPGAVGRQALLNDLDKAQMVVLQLAFWLLGVGILLGAYWADHAWGRWWAWDPKETWALITWIIYLAVIHLRVAVRRRGLVTAWMSVLGFGVMLWTYWGVNLLLAGLHSYA